jgi:hypothetical protein
MDMLYKSKIASNEKVIVEKANYQSCSAEEEEDGHAVLQIIKISFGIMRTQDSNTVFYTAFFQSSNSKGKKKILNHA